MAEGKKMPLAEARDVAEMLVERLSPFCERIEIAGSIRRKREMVSDIEIVCIPKTTKAGLFGEDTQRLPEFVALIHSIGRKVKGDPANGKYCQRITPLGRKVDIFIAEPGNWGMIFLIRTGSSKWAPVEILRRFNRWNYKSVGGYPTHQVKGDVLEFREEAEVFEFLQIPFVEPENRELEGVG